ncbi:MAG: formylglycine-generating enzyme family protein [Gammaproteobacteria bacterium]|jgi:formylglycine-generating enzyme required for sulfatase activity
MPEIAFIIANMSRCHCLPLLMSIVLLSWVLHGCSLLSQEKFEPLQTFQDPLSIGGLGPKMVVIPAGSFIMGPSPDEPLQLAKEKPRHKVTINNPFAISQYEITFADFDKFVAATGYRKPSDKGWGTAHWGRGNMPVFDVTWYDAQNYIEWLSEQTGERYQLPAETQWEYAARAGTKTAFHTGDCIHTDQANFHGRYEFGDCPLPPLYRGKTTPVGSFEPNAWGLYDVHGNIFEWTRDCWHTNYVGAPDDESGWMYEGDNVECERRVLRGGSWSGRPADIRSAARSRNFANFKSIFIGFRVVRDLN